MWHFVIQGKDGTKFYLNYVSNADAYDLTKCLKSWGIHYTKAQKANA